MAALNASVQAAWESRGGQDATVHDMPGPAKKTAKKAAKKTGGRKQRSAY